MLSTAATSRKSYRKGYDTKCIKKETFASPLLSQETIESLFVLQKLLRRPWCCKNRYVAPGVNNQT